MTYSPKVLKIIFTLKSFLTEEQTTIDYRTEPKYFTRKSKMNFPTYALLGSSLLKKSLSVELYNILEVNNIDYISKSAYSQGRYKICPKFYQAFDSLLLDSVYGFSHTSPSTSTANATANDCVLATKKWRGYFLDAIDGSSIVLPKTAALIAHFGTHGSKVKTKAIRTTMARLLVRTDLLNEYVVQTELCPTTESELSVCKRWIYQLNSEAISIFDRGFASAGIFFFLVQMEKLFVCRLKVSFNNVVKEFMASSSLDSEVYFTVTETESFINQSLSNFKEIASTDDSSCYTQVTKGVKVKVRLVKVLLPTGEIEVLATSLYDKNTISIADLSDLYQLRWGVETILNSLKNQLQMMVFSGIKPNAILQEIYACIFVYNLRQLLINEAQLIVNEENAAKIVANKVNKIQLVVNEAQLVINEAQLVVNEAQLVANEAQLVANEAQLVVNEAQLVVNEAQLVVNEAQIVVNEAQIVINEAQIVINEAQIVANEQVNKIKKCNLVQKINKNVALGVLKPSIMTLFLDDNPKRIIDKLISYFVKNKISKKKLAKYPPRQKSLAKRRNLNTQYNYRRAI